MGFRHKCDYSWFEYRFAYLRKMQKQVGFITPIPINKQFCVGNNMRGVELAGFLQFHFFFNLIPIDNSIQIKNSLIY